MYESKICMYEFEGLIFVCKNSYKLKNISSSVWTLSSKDQIGKYFRNSELVKKKKTTRHTFINTRYI